MAKNPFKDVSTDDLIAQSQALGIDQDTIRAQRLAIADELRARAGSQDGTAQGVVLTAEAATAH